MFFVSLFFKNNFLHLRTDILESFSRDVILAPIEDLLLSLLLLVFIVRNDSTVYIQSDVLTILMDSRGILIVPRTRFSTIGDLSFRVTVAQAWNSLPTKVTASTSTVFQETT